jgi:hypothetical protein
VPPQLTFHCSPPEPRLAVLVMHGGRATSIAPTTRSQLAVLRMIPFARAIGRTCGADAVVTRLRFSARGWNGDGGGPLDDARWALDELSQRFPDVPIALVGHSMGGRAALRISGDARVSRVVALAPWLPPGEPVTDPGDATVVLLHGDRDGTTSARASAAMVDALRRRGARAGFALVTNSGHPMLRRARVWHRLCSALICAAVVQSGTGNAAAAAPLDGRHTVTVHGSESWLQ